MIDTKTNELIAIAASVVAKCQPCLDYHIGEAIIAGATSSEIKNAVSIARMIRKAGDENMDKYVDDKLGGVVPEQKAPEACCCSKEKCSQ